MKFQEWKLIISTVLFLMSLFVSNIEWLFYSLIMISYLIVGYEVIIDSIKNILKREFFDENFLMVLATVGAIFIGEYHEALLVMLLFQIGEYLQEKAIAKSRRSISDLMELKSDTAMIQKDGKESIVPLKDVQLGDIMIVKPGENIPLDGKIIEGHSNIDMRALTGETIPVTVKPGDSILSGSINESGLLMVMVEKTEQESTVTKILELIEHASDKKTKTEKFMTKFSKIYTPTIVIFAFLIALIPSIITKDTSTWVYRSIIFLVLSCPCALVISIPLGFFSGIGACSKIGMLVKGSNELEKLSKIRSIAFDKTGTLTEGVFEVTKIETEMDVDQFLSYVIALEQYSNHPIAQSILKLKTNSSKVNVENIQEQPGKGIIGIVDNQHIMIGNDQLCAQEKIVVPTVETIGTILYVILEKKYIGHVIISDKIKEHAK